MKVSIVVVPVLLASAGAASAQMPHMGGDMKHVMVHRMMDDVMVMVDTMVPTPELRNYAEMYMGNASVLNDTWYNAQYGWVKEGTWTPPTAHARRGDDACSVQNIFQNQKTAEARRA
jgi:hypothetical protein